MVLNKSEIMDLVKAIEVYEDIKQQINHELLAIEFNDKDEFFLKRINKLEKLQSKQLEKIYTKYPFAKGYKPSEILKKLNEI